jgi:hypothetical protein
MYKRRVGYFGKPTGLYSGKSVFESFDKLLIADVIFTNPPVSTGIIKTKANANLVVSE